MDNKQYNALFSFIWNIANDVLVHRPKLDKEGKIVQKKGQSVMACNKMECEQILLLYPGGIDAFYEQEVNPYDAEAEFGAPPHRLRTLLHQVFLQARAAPHP